MNRFIALRLLYSVIVIWLVSIFVFTMSRVAGDPRNLYLDDQVTQEQYDAWGRDFGLDKPLVVQYLIWAGDALQGDFGRSLFYKVDAMDIVIERVPATLQLGAVAFAVSLIIGIPFGVLSAVKRGTAMDYFGRSFALLGQALPVFWIGIMLILVFAVQLQWLPTSRRDGWEHFVLPTVALGWGPAAVLLRITRSAMLEVLDSEYIKLARAKGSSSTRVVWKHAFKNALIPPITAAGLILAGFLTGTVVIETVFAWPGLGALAVGAIFNNDFPVMTAVIMLFAGLYLGISLVVDLTYLVIDPRIRYS